VIFVGGLSQAVEGEEGQEEGVIEGTSQGDRNDLNLPAVQENLLKAIHALGKPIVLVLVGGSAVAVNWANDNLPAILCAWYPGQDGGTAIADVLFGQYNPAGRLPVTFYKSEADLPLFDDYSMAGRTYRYFQGQPLYPFGFGLSYTTFAYTNLRVSANPISTGDTLVVSADVQNTGTRAGDEVVQVYISHSPTSDTAPIRSLRGFQRIHLTPRESKTVSFELTPWAFSQVDDTGRRINQPGARVIHIGGGQPDAQQRSSLSATIEISGESQPID
jgi:Glycosyl hydrolase family 3 C terminal domain.